MRIAVDVMGGDHGTAPVVEGAMFALRELPAIQELILVGHQDEIEACVRRNPDAGTPKSSRWRIVHASEVLTMEDKPIVGLRKKRDCSIIRAVELVKEGKAEAIISPGNTGGVVAASTLKLRPILGVDRPGIATVMPTPKNDFVLIDAGGNIDCRPAQLAHYAVMGNVYARDIAGLKNPRVGLLSVGTEDVKGNELTLEAFKLCSKLDLNFIGNVEGHDLFANRVDVVVCDGFVGNVVLKTSESLATNVFDWLKRELTATPMRYLGALLARGALRKIKRRLDPDNYGGAPLLGLNGIVLIAHGSAGPRAIKNAVHVAARSIEKRLTEVTALEITRANQREKESPHSIDDATSAPAIAS